MNTKPDTNYMLNPAYTLVPDDHCAFLTNSKGISSFFPPELADDSFLQMIAPLYALLFSYWDGRQSYQETIRRISEENHLEEKTVREFIDPCIGNEERTWMKYPQQTTTGLSLQNWIPPRFIIPAAGNIRNDLPGKQAFLIPKEKWDFTRYRSRIPLTLTLMLTNQCVTDCIYCYADKRHIIEQPLSADKWISVIEEADRIGCLNVDIAGGEVFLFPGIERILETLFQHGYTPYLSTKIPLSEARIIRLKSLGVKQLQLSIDAWDASTLKRMLNVSENYFDQLRVSLAMLQKHQITVKVKSVITRFNDSVSSIEKLLQHLTAFDNISSISLAPAEFSIYKKMEGFLQYRTTLAQWQHILDFVDKFNETYQGSCDISCQAPMDANECTATAEVKRDHFSKRVRCTGNINSMYVLADGKVGICEELYWNPDFLIGDLRTQSILEVWESERALSLYHLSREQLVSDSACRNCSDFAACHQQSSVCWKYVIEAYGSEHWDYPDPRCPKAPSVTHHFFIQ